MEVKRKTVVLQGMKFELMHPSILESESSAKDRLANFALLLVGFYICNKSLVERETCQNQVPVRSHT